jgi:hypothetical protein
MVATVRSVPLWTARPFDPQSAGAYREGTTLYARAPAEKRRVSTAVVLVE